MNEDKKLMSAIVIVAIAIFLVSGGTLAYWQWSTSTAQGTLVNGSPAGNLNDTKMYIDFPENELTNLYPTSDCEANGTSSWVTEITIDNKTGVVVAPNFKLKVKIEDKNGNVITNTTNTGNSQPNRYYIKYAVTAENESCQNALYTGRFDQNTQTVSGQSTWYDSGLITEEGTDGFPLVSGKIGSGVSFHAKANGETTQRFRVYAWLSNEYTSVNVGTEVTDTMQNAKVTVSWSENSNLEQIRKTKTGTAYAVYSADDESLRFYRSTTPITVGSTYNGRTATYVYTGFETTSYISDEVPWHNISGTVNSIVFEDYIYPISTYDWFGMFIKCKWMDLKKLDTSNVTNMAMMFNNISIDVLDLSSFDTSKVTNMDNMFYGATINDIIGIENWDTSNVVYMEEMFYLTTTGDLDLSGWNVCKVSTDNSFSETHSGTIKEPHFGNAARCNGDTNVGKANAVGDAYAVRHDSDNSLRFYRSTTPITVGSSIDGRVVSSVYTGFENSSTVPWDYMDIELVVFEDYVYPISTVSWFEYFEYASEYDVQKLDTSSVTDMNNMFTYATGEIIGLEKWNTSNVTDMSYMFYEFAGTVTGIEKWDTSNVTDMSGMFYESSLGYYTSDLSGWNVCHVTNYDNFNVNSSNVIAPHFGNAARCNGGNPA